MRMIDEVGNRHHGWNVERRAQRPYGVTTSGQWFLCRCDCGHAEVIRGKELRTGVKRACHNADDLVPQQLACPARLWDEFPCVNKRAGHTIHFYDIRRAQGATQ